MARKGVMVESPERMSLVSCFGCDIQLPTLGALKVGMG